MAKFENLWLCMCISCRYIQLLLCIKGLQIFMKEYTDRRKETGHIFFETRLKMVAMASQLVDATNWRCLVCLLLEDFNSACAHQQMDRDPALTLISIRISALHVLTILARWWRMIRTRRRTSTEYKFADGEWFVQDAELVQITSSLMATNIIQDTEVVKSRVFRFVTLRSLETARRFRDTYCLQLLCRNVSHARSVRRMLR
jgi:hypothetical protein